MNLKLIVCSPPDLQADEQEIVSTMLRCGLACYHLRKPSFSKQDLHDWLMLLPASDRKYVVIHSHCSLVNEFELKGIHIGVHALQHMNEIEKEHWIRYAKQKGLTISSSVHDQKEIEALSIGFSYVWLSPIFESISKPGYQSQYPASQFEKWIKFLHKEKQTQVFALGGITKDRIKELHQHTFDGAVILGDLWNNIQSLSSQQNRELKITSYINACQTLSIP